MVVVELQHLVWLLRPIRDRHSLLQTEQMKPVGVLVVEEALMCLPSPRWVTAQGCRAPSARSELVLRRQ